MLTSLVFLNRKIISTWNFLYADVEPAISVAYQSFDNEPGQGEAKKDKVASSTSMPLNLTQPKDSLKNLVPSMLRY